MTRQDKTESRAESAQTAEAARGGDDGDEGDDARATGFFEFGLVNMTLS